MTRFMTIMVLALSLVSLTGCESCSTPHSDATVDSVPVDVSPPADVRRVPSTAVPCSDASVPVFADVPESMDAAMEPAC